MNVQSIEQSLAKRHLLHLVIGIVLAVILVAVPKLVGIGISISFAAIFLPAVILPDFPQRKWLDHVALLAGGIIIVVLAYFLGAF